jgi:hypothetical protein
VHWFSSSILHGSIFSSLSSSLGLICVPECPLLVSQGRLVRTILFGTEHASANTRDAAIFVSVLLAFALTAASYVLYHGLADEKRR